MERDDGWFEALAGGEGTDLPLGERREVAALRQVILADDERTAAEEGGDAAVEDDAAWGRLRARLVAEQLLEAPATAPEVTRPAQGAVRGRRWRLAAGGGGEARPRRRRRPALLGALVAAFTGVAVGLIALGPLGLLGPTGPAYISDDFYDYPRLRDLAPGTLRPVADPKAAAIALVEGLAAVGLPYRLTEEGGDRWTVEIYLPRDLPEAAVVWLQGQDLPAEADRWVIVEYLRP
ncbi:MAG: hypothetical protein ACFCBW_22405 [Candidatus Competibacterales bacterium]